MKKETLSKIDFEKSQQEQIVAIKRKLKKAFSESNLSYYKIQQLLQEKKYGGYNISYNTVCQTLNPEDLRSPNLFAIMGMARMWNLDFTSIFSMPTGNAESDSQIERLDDYSKQGGFAPLSQPAYIGRFYGYMCNPNLSEKNIVCFTLDITEDSNLNITKAELEYIISPENLKNETVTLTMRYSGRVYLVTRPRNIIMLLTNSDGGYMFLAMNYIEHHALPMYYRPGIAVTSSSANEDVTALNVIIVKERLSEEKETIYLPGLLNFTGRQFAVAQEDIDQLIQNGDQDIAAFMEEMDGYIPGKKTSKGNVYWIKDDTVLSIIGDEKERDQYMKAFIKLKSYALSQPFMEYKYIPEYTRFGKEFLQDPNKK